MSGPSLKLHSIDRKGQGPACWPDDLAREARYNADVFLAHDTEAIAALAHRSRRDVNRLREWGSPDEQRLTEVETLARYLWAGRELGFSFDRRAALIAPLFEALGADPSVRLEVVGELDLVPAIQSAVRECGEAAARALDAASRNLTPAQTAGVREELRQAISALHKVAAAVDQQTVEEPRP